MEAMFMPFRRYANFSARARRKDFWGFFLFVWVMLFVLMYLDTALGLGGTATGYAEGGSVGFNMTGGLLTMVFAIGALVPSIAVSVRRLHDIGKSGWTLLVGLIPFLGWLYLLFLYVQPGATGPNAYGADPKGTDPGKVFV